MLLSDMWTTTKETKSENGGCCAERQWKRQGGYLVQLCRKTEDPKKDDAKVRAKCRTGKTAYDVHNY